MPLNDFLANHHGSHQW